MALAVALVTGRPLHAPPAGAVPLVGLDTQRRASAERSDPTPIVPSVEPSAPLVVPGSSGPLPDAGVGGRVGVPPGAVGTHRLPVAGVVVAPWDAPTSRYGPGHRGVDLAVRSGEVVRTSAGGTVGFAGVVAGRAWVSIDHASGLRTTVGPLATIAVDGGDRVAGSAVVGTAAGTAHADATTPRTDRLHWSARVDGVYVDPIPLVGRLVATLLPPG